MRTKTLFVFPIALLLAPASALAQEEAEKEKQPEKELSATDELIDAVSIHETKLRVVPRSEAMKEPPNADAPVSLKLPKHELTHRDRGQVYLDPFLGRIIYPELATRISTTFARELTPGTPSQKGPTALVTRADLNLWIVDLRVGFSTSDAAESREPLDLVLKAPFSAGDHWFAPIMIFHFPLDTGPAAALYEAGIGYHGRFGPLALKLEVTGFNGLPDRTRGAGSRGMLGWDGVVSLLAGEHLGIVLEARGATVVSEVGGVGPEQGDTVVQLVPGIRIFPKNASYDIGLAGLITVTSGDYSTFERHGGMISMGYTFY